MRLRKEVRDAEGGSASFGRRHRNAIKKDLRARRTKPRDFGKPKFVASRSAGVGKTKTQVSSTVNKMTSDSSG